MATYVPAETDDAAKGTTSNLVSPIGGFCDESGTDSVDEGDVGAVRMTADRKLLTRVVGATDANRLDVDASGHAQVDIAAASVAVPVSGDVAHDSPDAGEPVKVGMKAVAHGSNPTAVAAADRTNWYANRHGIPFVLGGHPNVITTEFHFTTAQTNTALITVSSGTKIVVTRCSAMLDADGTANVAVRVGFAASTLSAVSSSGVSGIVLSHPDLMPGSGIVEGTGSGILGIGADDEDLRISSDAATGGSLRIVVTYFTIES